MQMRNIVPLRTAGLTFGLLLAAIAVGAVQETPMVAEAHHHHFTPDHWASFPTGIPVYSCNSGGTVNTSKLQEAVNNWNSNGGLGTIFVYSGVNCTPASGIYVVGSTTPGVGDNSILLSSSRAQEVLKDSTQLGRFYHRGYSGQRKATKARIRVNPAFLNTATVYAHELGHSVGLTDHYYDIAPLGQNACTGGSVMCGSATDDSTPHGPTAHDTADARARFQGSPSYTGRPPWGPGAIWVSTWGSTFVNLNWAEINDNESNQLVYACTPSCVGLSGPADTGFRNVQGSFTSLSCLSVEPYNASGSSFSSSICLNQNLPSTFGPNNVVVGLPVQYAVAMRWQSVDPTYTHEVVQVWKGQTLVAMYYVPAHGTGYYVHSVVLGDYAGNNDYLPGTIGWRFIHATKLATLGCRRIAHTVAVARRTSRSNSTCFGRCQRRRPYRLRSAAALPRILGVRS